MSHNERLACKQFYSEMSNAMLARLRARDEATGKTPSKEELGERSETVRMLVKNLWEEVKAGKPSAFETLSSYAETRAFSAERAVSPAPEPVTPSDDHTSQPEELLCQVEGEWVRLFQVGGVWVRVRCGGVWE